MGGTRNGTGLISGAVLAACTIAVAVPSSVSGQEMFHSSQSANLPTTETFRARTLLFEISHRFQPAVSEGLDALYGLDGGVYNRLGLALSPSEGMLFGVQRTNRNDNVEIWAKFRVSEPEEGDLPQSLAVMFGGAWDTAFDTDRFSYYAQLIWNASINEQLMVGMAPAYVWRRSYESIPAQAQDGQFALGAYSQLYLTRSMSLLGEWITANEPSGQAHDSGTFGIELQTRGHFFKIVVTNQIAMNPTQYLMGSPIPFDLNALRLGFNIQRRLPL